MAWKLSPATCAAPFAVKSGDSTRRTPVKSGTPWTVVAALALILTCALPARAWDAPPVGSARLLAALWPDAELTAAPTQNSGPRTAPDRTPPARTEPVMVPPPLPNALRGNIRSVRLPEGDRRMALTFDLCELADRVSGYAGPVVSLLRRENVPATLFLGGKWMRSHPERAMQLMADPLFEVGNHAWSHGNLGVMNLNAAREQVEWTQAEYELLRAELARRAEARGLGAEMASVPAIPRLFRLPYGRCRPETLDLLASLGLPAAQWDIVADENASDTPPAERARRMAERARPGSIILMHANGVPRDTHAVLAALIPELRRRGLEFATVSKLLAAGAPEAVGDGWFERPGDNRDLDRRYGDGTTRVE